MEITPQINYYNHRVTELRQSESIESISYRLPFKVFTKWRWYLEYRSALLRVKYPRHFHHIDWGVTRDIAPKEYVTVLEDRLKRRKGLVTEWKNKLRMFEESWNSLFPFEEDVTYQKAVEKIKKHEAELMKLEKEIKEIKP